MILQIANQLLIKLGKNDSDCSERGASPLLCALGHLVYAGSYL